VGDTAAAAAAAAGQGNYKDVTVKFRVTLLAAVLMKQPA